jgi:hypothetical protein
LVCIELPGPCCLTRLSLYPRVGRGAIRAWPEVQRPVLVSEIYLPCPLVQRCQAKYIECIRILPYSRFPLDSLSDIMTPIQYWYASLSTCRFYYALDGFSDDYRKYFKDPDVLLIFLLIATSTTYSLQVC